MTIKTLHLVSAYALWCLGTFGLWLGDSEVVQPYPAFVVVAAMSAFLLTDTMGWIKLSSWLSNTIGVGILAKIFYDLKAGGGEEALTSLAHFLIYLQTAKWFRTKSKFDLGLIYLMNILQIAIGSILAKQGAFGAVIALYFFLSIWCGMLFFLSNHANDGDRVVDLRFGGKMLLRAVGLWFLGIPMALSVFWLLPRSPRDQQSAESRDDGSQWTGFSAVVSLEKDGAIYENPEIAFSVRCRDHLGESVTLPAELLWRGSVFTRYDRGAWRNARFGVSLSQQTMPRGRPLQEGEYELTIDKRSASGIHLFAPTGVVAGDILQSNLKMKYTPGEECVSLDESLWDTLPANLSYRLIVEKDRLQSEFTSQADETLPVLREQYDQATRRVPRNMDRVRTLVESLVEEVPAEDFEERAKRLYEYLTLSGQFSYTLELPARADSLDPVEDFLFERQQGHCEYFASTLAVMLRFAGVPSRVVSGFKGMDLNVADGRAQVRQMLAHAWVEAYIPTKNAWLTLDPTPGEERNIILERQRPWWQPLVDVRDVLTRLWGNYVVNFSVEDQWKTIQSIVDWTAGQVGMPLVTLQEQFTRTWRENAFGLILMGVFILIALIGAIVAAILLIQRGMARRRRWLMLQRYRVPAVRRWLEWVDRQGWPLQPGQTLREHAEAIACHLAENPRTQPWQNLAGEIAEHWYRLRFGAEFVPESTWTELDARARQLARELRPPSRAKQNGRIPVVVESR